MKKVFEALEILISIFMVITAGVAFIGLIVAFWVSIAYFVIHINEFVYLIKQAFN